MVGHHPEACKLINGQQSQNSRAGAMVIRFRSACSKRAQTERYWANGLSPASRYRAFTSSPSLQSPPRSPGRRCPSQLSLPATKTGCSPFVDHGQVGSAAFQYLAEHRSTLGTEPSFSQRRSPFSGSLAQPGSQASDTDYELPAFLPAICPSVNARSLPSRSCDIETRGMETRLVLLQRPGVNGSCLWVLAQ